MQRSRSYDDVYLAVESDAYEYSMRRIQSTAQMTSNSGSFEDYNYAYQEPQVMSQALRDYSTNELLSVLRSLGDESFCEGSIVVFPEDATGRRARISISEITAEIIARRDQRPPSINHRYNYCSFDEEFDSPSPSKPFSLLFFWLAAATILKKVRAKYCSIMIAVFIMVILSLVLLSIIVPIVVTSLQEEPFPTSSSNESGTDQSILLMKNQSTSTVTSTSTSRQINVGLDCTSEPAHFGLACDYAAVMIRYDKVEDKALLTLNARPVDEQYCHGENTSLVVHQLKLDKCAVSSQQKWLPSKNLCGEEAKQIWCQRHSLHGPMMYCYCKNNVTVMSWTRAYINDWYEDTDNKWPCGMWIYNGINKDGKKVAIAKYCTVRYYDNTAPMWLKTVNKTDSTQILVQDYPTALLHTTTVDEDTNTWAGIYKTSLKDTFCLCDFELSSVTKRRCFDLKSFPALPGVNHIFHHLLSMWDNNWLVVRHEEFMVNETKIQFVAAQSYDRYGQLLGQTSVIQYEQLFPNIHLPGYESVNDPTIMVNKDLHCNQLLLVYQTGFNDRSPQTAINATVAILSFDFLQT
uniref:Uncharacterized protein n=2 Tax=Plectus sambesii TaxID=2011161 RepID=A0A914W7K6_9BILA